MSDSSFLLRSSGRRALHTSSATGSKASRNEETCSSLSSASLASSCLRSASLSSSSTLLRWFLERSQSSFVSDSSSCVMSMILSSDCLDW